MTTEVAAAVGGANVDSDRTRSSCMGNSTSELEERRTKLDAKVTLITMEMSQLMKAISRDIDPINYCEKLAQISASLRETFSSFSERDLHSEASISAVSISMVSSEKSSADHHRSGVSVVTGDNIDDHVRMINMKPLPEESKANQLHGNDGGDGDGDKRDTVTGVILSHSFVDDNHALSKRAQASNAVAALSIVTEPMSPDDATTHADDDPYPPPRSSSSMDGDDGNLIDGAESIDIMEDFVSIPGWHECLNTSMASAAHHAAFYGYPEVLSCLCRYFDCFVMDKKGRTPLFYAALQNRLDCVAMLVELDAQWIDVGDEKGDTSLHAAAIADGVDVLDFLVSCEAQIDTANYMGLTPSHLARSRQALQCLFKAGAQLYCVDNNSRMPLWFACAEGRSDCVDYLCEVTPPQYLLWPDDEGETSLHKAAMNGHASCVEVLCQHLSGIEDLYTPNKKQFTAAHVASNVDVLRALYENGANVWITESKDRTPLFMASFFGRIDNVFFLLDLANNTNNLSKVNGADVNGDTALHAACLCGHVQCVSLLLYFISPRGNKQDLAPDQLALRAGHQHIAALVSSIEEKRRRGQETGSSSSMSMDQIFGCDFTMLSSIITYYGSRWCKYYDHTYDSSYYYDHVTGTSQWDRPYDFDMSSRNECKWEQACTTLLQFYRLYNPDRVRDLNDILVVYRDRYTELFLTLAEKYRVTDLSMFKGIDLD
jgi:ankyrin repeat protein